MSSQRSNVTFLCTHCHARFTAPGNLRGARTLCNVCKAVTFVVLRAPTESEAQNQLLEKLRGTTPRWIRTRCTCGKSIKAQASLAGQSGACPRCGTMIQLPRSTTPELQLDAPPGIEPAHDPGHEPPLPAPDLSEINLLPTSEDSCIMHLGPNELSASEFDFREIKHDRILQIKSDPAERFDGFVRALCGCGQRVKAPAEQGGKMGTCPNCSGPVAMPLPPVFKLVSEHDAMAMEDIEVDDMDQSGIIAVGSLADAIDHSREARPAPKAPPQPDVDSANSGTGRLQSLAGDTPMQQNLFFAKLRMRIFYGQFRFRVLHNPAVVLGASLMCVVTALGLLFWAYKMGWLL